jgi:hypothetical protein
MKPTLRKETRQLTCFVQHEFREYLILYSQVESNVNLKPNLLDNRLLWDYSCENFVKYFVGF